MHDKNGKETGVLAHIVKTNISDLNNDQLTSSICHNLMDVKVNDDCSNNDIFYDSTSKEPTNKNKK